MKLFTPEFSVEHLPDPHPRDEDQVSYHTLVGLDGSIVDVVDPLKRAYGAGYSAFHGEWAVTNAEFQGSVNNFALHLSLETLERPECAGRHSGYTPVNTTPWLVLDDWLERFQFPPSAIITHRHVDLGGERGDPRSFSRAEPRCGLLHFDALRCLERSSACALDERCKRWSNGGIDQSMQRRILHVARLGR